MKKIIELISKLIDKYSNGYTELWYDSNYKIIKFVWRIKYRFNK